MQATSKLRSRKIISFGLIADIHQDIMHDGASRVSAFVTSMEKRDAEFICQLGDFCLPNDANRPFFKIYDKFAKEKYHVIGNHDTDGGFTSEQVLKYYGMESRYYSFDKKGIHFVALDGNEPGGVAEGYKRFVSKEQLDWLRDDLRGNKLPVVVFSHQSFAGDDEIAEGVENSEQVREVLETRESEEQGRVIAAFNGHNHEDALMTINNIHYVMINSASNYWVGDDYKAQSYSQEIHEKYPWIEYTIPYRDPLWAFVSINLEKSEIIIEGRKSSYVGPGPKERNLAKCKIKGDMISSAISDRRIKI